MSEDVRKELKPGMVVKVHQKIREKGKERIQIFEGIILAIKHGSEVGATVTVRKVSKGFGVEKIFPVNSPNVAKFEFVRQMKVRQARPMYIRTRKKKLKEIKDTQATKKAPAKKEEPKVEEKKGDSVSPEASAKAQEKTEAAK